VTSKTFMKHLSLFSTLQTVEN